MAHKDGTKSGGRQKGTANKSTRELKGFLDRVFARAFTETTKIKRPGPTGDDGEVEVTLEDLLVAQILSMTMDPALLRTLLAYYAGSPAKQVDHTHKGKVTLEQIVAGDTAAAAADEDEDA